MKPTESWGRAAPGVEQHAEQAAETACHLADLAGPGGWSAAAAEDVLDAIDTLTEALGRVRKVSPARRRLARTLAALSGSPRYIQYRGDPPPCDRTHQTPPSPPSGRTTILCGHALGSAEPELARILSAVETATGDARRLLGIAVDGQGEVPPSVGAAAPAARRRPQRRGLGPGFQGIRAGR
ncbi:hypothetical protein PZ61_0238010 [Streptomyces sp. MNU77]|nr:hypothetical protein PZ61_0238010 [Streptomyces sp. MNU77]